MKIKSKCLLFIIIFITGIGILSLTSCKRGSVNDQDMIGPAGFRINLSGTASPSTLYVPGSQPAAESLIRVRVLRNDGTPLANFKIIFEEGIYGYFEGLRISDFRFTDANGIAEITYYIAAGASVRNTVMTNVTATLIDDGRLDIPAVTPVNDVIPIRIIPYVEQGVMLHGHVTTPAGNGVANVAITLAGLDGNASGVAITRTSGSYEFYVASGWYGDITPDAEGYTFVPASYSFTSNAPVVMDMMNLDFIASFESGNTLATDVQSWSVPVGGGTQVVNVYNSTGDAAIGYSVVPDSPWIHVSNTSGTTPGSFTITVDENTTGVQRSGSVTITATDTQGSSVTIDISQTGDPDPGSATLTADITTLNVDSDTSTTTINVYNSSTSTSIDYVITPNAPWITVSNSTGATNDSFDLTVALNSGGARSGTVTLTPTTTGVTGNVTITVNQEAAPSLLTDQTSYTLGQAVGTNTRIYVSASDGSSRQFEIQQGVSWLDITPTSGTTATSSDFVTITTQTANTSGSSRTGTIIIKATNDDAQPVTVTVTQSG